MTKIQVQTLLSLCLYFASSVAFANLEKTDLYEAVLAAPSRQASERPQLFQDGLETVLKRVSGDRGLLKNKNIINALKSPGQYVEKFGYYDGQSLFVRYNPNAVNELVLEAGQPIWGQKRPTVLLWLAIADNSLERRIIGAENEPQIQADITQYASELGLPLGLPLMDLTDMGQVNVTDVWGEFPSVLHKASKRYDADIIVVAKVQKNHNDVWASQWQFMFDDYVQKWDWTSEARDSAIQEGVSQLARHLLQRYGLKKGQQTLGSILVGVQDITSISDFSKAEAYLNSLEQLDVVNVKEVTNQGVIFEVTTMGAVDPDILSQVISMDNKLVTLVGKDQVVGNTDLTYRFVESLHN